MGSKLTGIRSKERHFRIKIVNWLTIVIAALILKNSYQIHYGEKYTLIRMQTEVASLAAFLSAVYVVTIHSHGYLLHFVMLIFLYYVFVSIYVCVYTYINTFD
jgi:hypothetical protein